MILLCSTHNWCTSEYYDVLSEKFIVKIVSFDFNNHKINFKIFFKIIIKISQIIDFIFRRFKYYDKFSTLVEIFIFDLYASFYILFYNPKTVILWQKMGLLSILICKMFNIRLILYIGEPNFIEAKRRKNSFVWETLQKYEHKFIDEFIFESSYSKSTYNFVNKTIYIVPTLITINSDLYFKKNTNNVAFIIRGGYRDNLSFIINLIKELSNYNFNVFIFHSKSFDTTRLTEYNCHLIEFTNKKEFHRLISINNIGIFLLPTRGDGGPRTLIEMASLKTLCITSEFCISPDIVNYFNNIYIEQLKIQNWISLIFKIKNLSNIYSNYQQYNINSKNKLIQICENSNNK
jgi:hypothetical protein